jgi:hypothetical protein
MVSALVPADAIPAAVIADHDRDEHDQAQTAKPIDAGWQSTTVFGILSLFYRQNDAKYCERLTRLAVFS